MPYIAMETRGPWATIRNLNKTAMAYLLMPCNILPVLPQQLGQKLDRAIKSSKVILESSFEQIWKTVRPGCNMPRLNREALLVLEKKIFKCFYHIRAWRTPCSIVQNH